MRENSLAREKPLDFRAPPPSPVASGRPSSVTNDHVLTEFLDTSLRIPELNLPDKVFPKQKFIENPSKIDLDALTCGSEDYDRTASMMLESVGRVGCFQLVNFGIPGDLMRAALDGAKGVFRVPLEKRAPVTMSPENRFGFEEDHSDDEADSDQEFVWMRDKALGLEMEKLWPAGYSNFGDNMKRLQSELEKVAGKIFYALQKIFSCRLIGGKEFSDRRDHVDCFFCIHKHRLSIPSDQFTNLLRYDVIKRMVRANDYSHALCFHVFNGSTEFHVYSKKGWVSFCPEKDSIIVTVGDKFQAMTEGQYKHVVGRPMYKSEGEDRISISFLYSPSPPSVISPSQPDSNVLDGGGDVISIGQQVVVALFLALLYQLLVYIYKNFCV
ncbi:hypothetical protein SAY86_026673 [Trapa natans]|uniref:Non-haem dioxygenase N-terminal domain-containing protein n=1 Tax=Trapa natans TaxID=22666 RepID=A0AAN7KB70_TRANT|nr:hypothetical protein SAY86_026673 [Trapa natans]